MVVKRPYEPDERYAKLFDLLGELRGATATQLHELYFRRYSRTAALSLRAVQQRIERLVEHGYLQRYALPDSHQQLIHLTEKGRTAFPAVAAAYSDQVRKPPSVDVAAWAWQRSALWASLIADGWHVGGGLRALLAVRRYLLDSLKASAPRLHDAVLSEIRRAPELTPAFVWRCETCGWSGALNAAAPAKCGACDAAAAPKQLVIEHLWKCSRCGTVATAPDAPHGTCVGRLRRQRYLPYDVAYRMRDNAPPSVIILLVDNPLRSVEAQLLDLPLRFLNQPRIDVIVRPSDDDSVYDVAAGRWAMKGRRFRSILDAFTPHDNPRVYPFWVAAEVITYKPEVVLRTTARRHHAPF